MRTEMKLNTEMRLIRWTCAIKVNERKQRTRRTVSIGTSQFDDHQESVETVWTCRT